MPYRWSEQNTAILRIRTHLITEKDDPVDVIDKYTKAIAAPGDLVG